MKVRRPGIVQQMAEDILLMKHLLALAEFSTSQHEGIMLTLDGLVAELEPVSYTHLSATPMATGLSLPWANWSPSSTADWWEALS